MLLNFPMVYLMNEGCRIKIFGRNLTTQRFFNRFAGFGVVKIISRSIPQNHPF